MIISRGVVQLFNAVRSQQKVIEENLSSAGPTESKKAKAMEKMTKGKFLDLLKGTTVNVGKEEPKVEASFFCVCVSFNECIKLF